jgi:type I restriction enzyme R subunit
LKHSRREESSNIFPDLFDAGLRKINQDANPDEIARAFNEASLLLDNPDLGRSFYSRLLSTSGMKLIDFENFDNNSFHVVTELPCKNDKDEFRPDITLLINGLPLVFIEVKKPNNREGILAERNRIQKRFQNPKFSRFINMTQLMVFSNNMEYDDHSPEPLEGAFYATPALENPTFNYFREERHEELPELLELSPSDEDAILRDTNLLSIKHTAEYATNKDPLSPTNRLSTSLFSRERLAFLLRYGIVYLRGERGVEKHVMRYPQIFATKAIEEKIGQGTRKGIIWHTQGSGKTALAYYNVKHLTDYFQKQGTIPKFYFIVDRIDLLIQAAREFRSRGLIVHEVDSRDAFARDIRSTQAVHNDSGKLEITVVNIQKFKEDRDVVRQSDYKIDLQRIYFLDEVHRSYNPTGSFLANLNESDPNAIKIGLTGTPLLGDQHNSRVLFGDYIHKYYYNASIKDGYTLRLIREEIETEYKLQLKETLEQIEVLRGKSNRKVVYADERFVEPMLDYIVKDFEQARLLQDDATLGAMVICDSSEQAKMMSEIFEAKYSKKVIPIEEPVPFVSDAQDQLAAETPGIARLPSGSGAQDTASYAAKKTAERAVTTSSLILHDIGTKQSRKDEVEAFKEGKIDLLFVYNMLLTGFDAPRLKKLYLGRQIKSHNLLQALTRVNRTYRDHRYGYVVDFADISAEFEKTNKAYFDELQSELGDELDKYSDLFKSEAEITAEIDQIKDALWEFDTLNAETFSQQISQIQDRTQMLDLVKALNGARELYNIIRLSGRHELLESLDFQKLNTLAKEANNHLALLNQKIALEEGHDNTNILKAALEDVLFTFRKTGQSELRIADEFRGALAKTRVTMNGNFDPRDPEFVKLREELERLFKKKKLHELTQEDLAENTKAFTVIDAKARELNRKNELLRAKYENDVKYARLHKRLLEKYPLSDQERKLCEALNAFKVQADEKLSQNAQLLKNEDFAERELLRLAVAEFNTVHHFGFDAATMKDISKMVFKEYLDESNGRVPA